MVSTRYERIDLARNFWMVYRDGGRDPPRPPPPEAWLGARRRASAAPVAVKSRASLAPPSQPPYVHARRCRDSASGGATGAGMQFGRAPFARVPVA